jgi:cytochrome c-type biogenesis protein
MTSSPTLGLSLLAGILAFLSPCIVPLVPSYISFIGGVSASDDATAGRWRIVVRTAFFVVGFSAVFVTLGTVLAGSGVLFGNGLVWINIVSGLVIVLLGLNLMFDFWKLLNVERRFHVSAPAGVGGAFLMGMAFGAGWTPCIGPMLAAILIVAGTSGSVASGIVYLTAFSLGLGIPFLLASIFFSSLRPILSRIRKHARAIQIGSGVLLIGIGALVAFGRLQRLSSSMVMLGFRIQSWGAGTPYAPVVLGVVILVISMIPIVVSLIRRGAGVESARPWSVVKLVLLGIGLLVAILGAADVIDIPAAICRWLTYTGL